MKATILIVDDSETVRTMVRQTLSGDGYEILEAADGEQGAEVARERDLDLMIVDYNMPGINGVEMIRQVRELPRHRETPIFVLTTENDVDKSREGKQSGATAWMVKPFRSDHLLSGVRMVLAARGGRRREA